MTLLNHEFIRPLTIAAALFLMLNVAAPAQAQPVARVLDLYGDPSDDFALIREGERYGLTVYMTLEEGDVILVEAAAASVLIGYPGGRTERVTRSTGRRVIPARAPDVTLLDRIGVNILTRLRRMSERGEATPVSRNVQATPREAAIEWIDVALLAGPLRFATPGLGSGDAVLVSGDRDLVIAWSGGRAPFQIDVVDQSGALLAARSDLPHRLTVLEGLDLRTPRRRYVVRVRDAEGAVAFGVFDVVEERPRPETPPADTSLAPVDRMVLEAVWLAEQDEATWSLEALQGVARALGLRASAEPLFANLADPRRARRDPESE